MVLMAPCQFSDQCLAERSKRQCIFDGGRHIADTKLDSVKKWVRTHIPPDFFTIVDASCLHQNLYILVKIVPGVKDARHTTTVNMLPDGRTIRFDASEARLPERRVRGDGQQVR